MSLLICFVGVDGSGKTTSAIGLYEKLCANGFHCKYIHHTFSLTDYIPSPIRGFMRERVSSTANLNNPAFMITANRKHGRLKSVVEVMLSFISFIDSLIGSAVETRFFTNGIIIYDRYIYDRIIGYIDACPHWLTRFYLRVVPNPDVVFILDVPSTLAFERKAEGSLNFRVRQRKQYLNLSNQSDVKNTVIINTCQNGIDKVNSLVFNHTKSLLKGSEDVN